MASVSPKAQMITLQPSISTSTFDGASRLNTNPSTKNIQFSPHMVISKSTKQGYFFPEDPRGFQTEASPISSARFFTTQQFPSSSTEVYNKRNKRETPPLINPPRFGSLPAIHFPTMALSSRQTTSPERVEDQDQQYPHSPLQSAATTRDSEYLKQERFIRKNPHIYKFNQCLEELRKVESNRSLLSKEAFYYPEQAKVNKEFAERKEEMRKLEVSMMYHVKSRIITLIVLMNFYSNERRKKGTC